MRHLKRGRKLNRTESHRKALLMNLAMALFIHKRIKTTLPKAKELRSYAERLITFAKRGDVSARRHVAKFIHDRKTVQELFSEIAPKFAERPGGYTRIVKLGQRQKSDAAKMAFIELVGYEGFFRKKDEERVKQKEKEKEKQKK